MIDFEKEFKEMFADLLSNPDVIKEAEEEAEKEAQVYRAKKQAEFERSEVYKKAHKAAVQQLKEQKLAELTTSIDKEFEAKTAKAAQMTNFLSNPANLSFKGETEEKEKEKHPLTKEERSEIMKEVWAKRTPEEKAAIAAKRKATTAAKRKAKTDKKKKETRREKIKRTRKELEQETKAFVRNQMIEALFQISFNNEAYSSDNIYYAIEQGKSTNTPDQALATSLEIALENGIELNEIRERARTLVGEDVSDSSFNEIFNMYAGMNGDERLHKEIKARNDVIDFNNPADKNTDYSALEEFKNSKSEGFKF